MFIIGPWSYMKFKSNEIKTSKLYVMENLYGDMFWICYPLCVPGIEAFICKEIKTHYFALAFS